MPSVCRGRGREVKAVSVTSPGVGSTSVLHMPGPYRVGRRKPRRLHTASVPASVGGVPCTRKNP